VMGGKGWVQARTSTISPLWGSRCRSSWGTTSKHVVRAGRRPGGLAGDGGFLDVDRLLEELIDGGAVGLGLVEGLAGDARADVLGELCLREAGGVAGDAGGGHRCDIG